MFFDTHKNQIPGASIEEMAQLRLALGSDCGVTNLQIVESVAFSMAMVVRSALGLHAYQASIGILYHDSLAGWIALATSRHLSNAGCTMTLVDCSLNQPRSILIDQLLRPLRQQQIPELSWEKLIQSQGTDQFLSSCHNLVCGISGVDQIKPETKDSLAEILNEHSIPVHCIEAPTGLPLDSGQGDGRTLYASSTLSLGIPFQGLAAGHDWAGRHYLADISIPYSLITEILGRPFPILFSEQPVIQIFPPLQEES